jgi:hypothetical protein
VFVHCTVFDVCVSVNSTNHTKRNANANHHVVSHGTLSCTRFETEIEIAVYSRGPYRIAVAHPTSPCNTRRRMSIHADTRTLFTLQTAVHCLTKTYAHTRWRHHTGSGLRIPVPVCTSSTRSAAGTPIARGGTSSARCNRTALAALTYVHCCNYIAFFYLNDSTVIASAPALRFAC